MQVAIALAGENLDLTGFRNLLGLTATADIEIDRTKFDVRYGSDSFFDNLGDKVIKDIIKFSVSLKGAK